MCVKVKITNNHGFIELNYDNGEYVETNRQSDPVLDVLLPKGSKSQRIKRYLEGRVNTTHYTGDLDDSIDFPLNLIKKTNGEKFTDTIKVLVMD